VLFQSSLLLVLLLVAMWSGMPFDCSVVEAMPAAWRYVCFGSSAQQPQEREPSQLLATANVVCRQLGYQSASMAALSSGMAFGETVHFESRSSTVGEQPRTSFS